jgi:hypothetical protein
VAVGIEDADVLREGLAVGVLVLLILADWGVVVVGILVVLLTHLVGFRQGKVHG